MCVRPYVHTHLFEEVLNDSLLGDVGTNREAVLELSFDLPHFLLVVVGGEPLRSREGPGHRCVKSGHLEEAECLVNMALEGKGRERHLG